MRLNGYTHHLAAWNPFSGSGQVIEGLDDLKQRCDGRLANTLVIMGQKLDQFVHTWLDVWKEMVAGGQKHRSDGVGSDFLLYSNRTIDCELFILIDVLDVN
jgi:hypothetical protein